MPTVTIGIAIALIALGIGGYTASSAKTALIPAYAGALLLVCGLAALKPSARKHAMHAAVMIGLLGFLASAGKLLVTVIKGTLPSGLALFSQVGMAMLCAAFVGLCVRSFIQARKNRLAAAGMAAAPSSSARS